MDHTYILNQIRSRRNLERAFQYALWDRHQTDYYFDYFELEYAFRNKEAIIDSLLDELKDPERYTPRPAYAFYPPKTDLCFRRMIYIPFKDLVVRYAFVSVLADYLDSELSPRCFAKRRARGEQAKQTLLKDFATVTWSGFCSWQKDCAEKHSVLLRTDISAFYDSISHDYLISLIARELAVQEDTILMRLFRRILCIPVISYSHFTGEPQQPLETKQGLAIGNNTEGFLANLYLKDVDELMNRIEGVEFGRYNDDMRIFGGDRKTVLDAVLALQETLLTKGLNLNSGKSQIAENEQEIEELRSKYYEVYFYHVVEEVEVIEHVQREINKLKDEIDAPFDEFDRRFEADEDLENNNDAKDFCKFVSDKDLLPLEERAPEHVEKLGQILRQWQGCGKHASWLIVQSAFWKGIPDVTCATAQRILLESLRSDEVDSYSKYRLIHHLVKRHGKDPKFRFLDQFSESQRNEFIGAIPDLLRQPAFELNIIGLYALRVFGMSFDELQEYTNSYMPRPIGEPIKKALSYIREPMEITGDLVTDSDREPDDTPQPY